MATVSIVVGAQLAAATPATAYERTGTFAGSAVPGGAAVLPAGLAVSVTAGAVAGAVGTVSVGAPVADPHAAVITSPAGMGDAPAVSIQVHDGAGIDSAYHPVGMLTVALSRPVRNPRLHLFDLGATAFAIRLVLTGAGAPMFVPRAGWTGWTVSSTQIAPQGVAVAATGGCGGTGAAAPYPRGCGSVQLLGTVSAVTLRVDAARTSLPGVDTDTDDTFDLNATVDEDLGNAPASYGGAGHILSDLTIGSGVTADGSGVLTGDGTAVPTPSSDTNDAVITFPPLGPATTGQPYTVNVPVAGVSAAATLAGWIDVNGNGRFDPAERALATVAAGQTTATLTWAAMPTVVPGPDRPVRLRLGYDATQVGSPTGLADSGEVDDRTVTIAGIPPGPAAACAGSVYVLSGPIHQLAAFNLATGAATTIGPLGGAPATLAMNPLDRLLYATSPGSRAVSVIDPATGASLSTFVPTAGNGGAALAAATYGAGTVGSDGTLYLIARGSNTLVEIDLNPSSSHLHTWRAVTFGGASAGTGDAAVNPADGELYLIDPDSHQLSRIDPATGTRTALGTVPGAAGTADIFDSIGDLYDISPTGAVREIDLTRPGGGSATTHRVGALLVTAASGTAAPAGAPADPTAPVADAAGCVGADDYGDAPATYEGGTPARNAIVPGLALGAEVDAEPGPATDVGVLDGRGDDRDGRDDDDAFTTLPDLDVHSGTYALTVPLVNRTGAPATLAGWLDVNGDGTFTGAERATATVAAGATSAVLTWSGLTGAPVGSGYARLRLFGGTVGDPSPVGPAAGLAARAGEVEDYPLRRHAVPVVTSPTTGELFNRRTPAISGTAEVGGTVTVTDGATVLCSAGVPASGSWACTPTAPLADGPHTLAATNVASDGDRQVGAPVRITVDATPPAAPEITSLADGDFVGTGTPALTGTGEPAAVVTVTRSGAVRLCGATVTGDGTWSCTPSAAIPDGSLTLTATAHDRAGNTATGTPVVVTVDTTPPPAPVITAPAGGAHGANPEITGTGEPGDTVTVGDTTGSAVCVATVSAAGSWSCTATAALPDGPVALTPTATDQAGNSTPGLTTHFTVDTTGPPAPVITSPADGSAINDPTPVVRGTGESGDRVTVTATGATPAACVATVADDGTWSCRLATPLQTGTPVAVVVTLAATEADAATNTTTGAPIHLDLDLVPPPAPKLTSPADGSSVNTGQPLLAGVGESGDTIVVTAIGSAHGADTPAASDHGATATGTGSAGTHAIAGSADVACSAVVATDGTWSCAPASALADGTITVTVTATDRAGNATTGPTSTVTVDTVPPAAAVIDTPAPGTVTNNAHLPISGRADPGDTVEVTDVGGASLCTATASTTGTWSCSPTAVLPDGMDTITPTATDRAGNATPGGPTIVTVDTVAPLAATVTRPAGGSYLAIATPVISGTGETGDTVTVADGSGAAVCSATVLAAVSGPGTWSCQPAHRLTDGGWRISAIATDPAGNSTPGAAVAFTVDTVAPPAARITLPANGSVTNDAALTVAGTGEAGDSVSVRDGAALLCTGRVTAGGAWSCHPAIGVPDGTVSLVATATDAAGNTTHGTPASGSAITVTVDTTPPPPAIITAPVSGSTIFTDTPVISGVGEAADTVIVADGHDQTICVATVQDDGSWSCPVADPLPNGVITLSTYAIDPAGNQSTGPAVRIRVDSGLPVAAVITAPADGTTVDTATPVISGTGESGDTVRVVARNGITVCVAQVGGGGDWQCTPARSLPQGTVTVTPMTNDPSGNEIPGSAIRFTVDSVPPPAPVLTNPANHSTVRTTRPLLVGRGEPTDTIEVTDGRGAVVCTATASVRGVWSCTPTQPLPVGPAVLTPTASDPAGNATPGSPTAIVVVP